VGVVIRVDGAGSVVAVSVGTEGVPKEVSKVLAGLGRGEGVVASTRGIEDTADGEQDLDALVLADGNVLHDLSARGKQLGLIAVNIVVSPSAVTGEVGARVARVGVRLWGAVYEGQSDIVDTLHRAGVGQPVEAILALDGATV
jgi:hypothetical protein